MMPLSYKRMEVKKIHFLTPILSSLLGVHKVFIQ